MKAKQTPTQCQLRELFDYQNGALVWRVSRQGAKKGQVAGMITERGYRRIRVDGRLHMAHRLVWAYHHDAVPEWIDHIDQDKQNNSIENLRPATKSQNGYNISVRKDNKSGAKGVYWARREQKWAVELSIEKRVKRIGYFDDFELAELVAHEARSLWHGPYASSMVLR